ncbi:hypothetical protein [Microbulbifer mangrovi]|uniref:hypothetical protein n=1 Tax=Microbulbifer mangrovi TaxID=927787 RepID=UPI001180438C|nr:hypothetical protein [Microbulbifer mangrovi]
MFRTNTILSSFSSAVHSSLCSPAVSLLVALAAFSPLSAAAKASEGWMGVGSADPLIRLAVTPVEIRIEAPTPLTGNNLELLLALSGSKGGLGDIRKKASEEFSQYLDQQVQMRFGEFFEDERVHLVTNRAPLTLHTDFDVVIRQKILDIFSSKDYDLEKGSMTAYGKFHYRLQGAIGAHVLREGTVDISTLKLHARYRTKAPKDGGVVEDTTREATERLLADIAEEVLDQVEDDLEADALLSLARR